MQRRLHVPLWESASGAEHVLGAQPPVGLRRWDVVAREAQVVRCAVDGARVAGLGRMRGASSETHCWWGSGGGTQPSVGHKQ
jgi:hypothetical protein